MMLIFYKKEAALDTKTSETNLQLDYDVVDVGAGFAGIYSLESEKNGIQGKGIRTCL